MKENRTETVNIEKANQYIEASKVNQANLWKRRQIEWKTSLSLWASIAITSGFIYRYASRPIPYPSLLFSSFVVVYSAIVFFQNRHLRAITMSNEKDLDFINYYLNKAAWELDRDDFVEKPSRPKWADSTDRQGAKYYDEERKFYLERKYKVRLYITQIMITVLISLLSLCLFSLMCFGE